MKISEGCSRFQHLLSTCPCTLNCRGRDAISVHHNPVIASHTRIKLINLALLFSYRVTMHAKAQISYQVIILEKVSLKTDIVLECTNT